MVTPRTLSSPCPQKSRKPTPNLFRTAYVLKTKTDLGLLNFLFSSFVLNITYYVVTYKCFFKMNVDINNLVILAKSLTVTGAQEIYVEGMNE